MLNQVILMGRITKEVETIESDKLYKVSIATQRNYKNDKGIYDVDFFNILLPGQIVTNTKEYCRKGDLIAIKGRIQDNNKTFEIVAEKVSFLASRKEEQED